MLLSVGLYSVSSARRHSPVAHDDHRGAHGEVGHEGADELLRAQRRRGGGQRRSLEAERLVRVSVHRHLKNRSSCCLGSAVEVNRSLTSHYPTSSHLVEGNRRLDGEQPHLRVGNCRLVQKLPDDGAVARLPSPQPALSRGGCVVSTLAARV
jgi:hypothetical protein